MQKMTNVIIQNRKKQRRRKQIIFAVALTLCIGLLVFDSTQIGKEIDQYKEVPVYYNGIFYPIVNLP